MKSILKITTAFLLILSTAIAGRAQEEFNKSFDKEYAVKKSTTLYVKNKYGQINVENWERNTVSIHVDVTVEHTNGTKAKTMIDAINVKFIEDGDLLSAITKFDEDIMKNNRKLFSSISDQELSIDYKIMAPKHLNIDILHKYGDIYMDEFSSKVRVELKYGKIFIQKLSRGDSDDINTLVLQYGSAEIGEANWLKLDVRYANDIEIEKARALVVLSRYSKFEIEGVNSMVIDSKYDHFSIGKITNIVGKSNYTAYSIENLSSRLKLETKYGEVKIEEVSDDFDAIEFNGSYSGFKAGIDSDVSYNLDARASYCSIKYYAPVAKVNRIEGNTSTEINGVIGTKSNPKAKVFIRTQYGNVNLSNY